MPTKYSIVERQWTDKFSAPEFAAICGIGVGCLHTRRQRYKSQFLTPEKRNGRLNFDQLARCVISEELIGAGFEVGAASKICDEIRLPEHPGDPIHIKARMYSPLACRVSIDLPPLEKLFLDRGVNIEVRR